VVRRVPGQLEGQVTIGVDALSRAPQALTLKRTQPQNRLDDEDVYIYVPGREDSGAHDAFLVPEKILLDAHTHDVRIGDDVFTLQFNRVRRKGRGWALAGFEIVQAKRQPVGLQANPAAPSSPLMLDLVPKADTPKQFDPAKTGAYPRFDSSRTGTYSRLELDDDDPYKAEVSARLL
jgi:hypothetical protein